MGSNLDVFLLEDIYNEDPINNQQDDYDLLGEASNNFDEGEMGGVIEETTSSLSGDELPRGRTDPPNDRDDSTETFFFDEHPVATVISRQTSSFESLYNSQVDIGKGNLFYPLAGEEEWEMAVWMHQTMISLKETDAFLRLKYVSITPQSKLQYAYWVLG